MRKFFADFNGHMHRWKGPPSKFCIVTLRDLSRVRFDEGHIFELTAPISEYKTLISASPSLSSHVLTLPSSSAARPCLLNFAGVYTLAIAHALASRYPVWLSAIRTVLRVVSHEDTMSPVGSWIKTQPFVPPFRESSVSAKYVSRATYCSMDSGPA